MEFCCLRLPQWLLGRGLLVTSPTVRGLQSTVCFPSRGEAVVAERFFCYVTKGKLLQKSLSLSKGAVPIPLVGQKLHSNCSSGGSTP